MKRINLNRFAKSVLIAALAASAAPTLAQVVEDATSNLPGTSDVGTKGICEPLKDAPKGLYGLCAAYCEVNDYVALLDPNAEIAPPNPRIQKRFDKIVADSATDYTLPCLVKPTAENYGCPVIDESRYALMSQSSDLTRSEVLENVFEDSASSPSLTDGVTLLGTDGDGNTIRKTIQVSVKAYRASASSNPYAYVGSWSEITLCQPGINPTGCDNGQTSTESTGALTYLTPAEFLGCRQIIVDTPVPAEQ